MIEKTESLLPRFASTDELKAICVGFEDDSLKELEQLLSTLGIKTANSMLVKIRSIHPATYIGKGKCEEIKNMLDLHQAHIFAIDVELSPVQLHNLEKLFTKAILDRPGVIIEIFSRHARTKEAKTQVELAKLGYLLPRLKHFWTHFERQRGGIGLKGV
ncbi:MAG: hypothetical protein HY843_00315, partial [Bdellovibrio sp.]|nr:hypothetical protein [Bdellovibrio sp.]